MSFVTLVLVFDKILNCAEIWKKNQQKWLIIYYLQWVCILFFQIKITSEQKFSCWKNIISRLFKQGGILNSKDRTRKYLKFNFIERSMQPSTNINGIWSSVETNIHGVPEQSQSKTSSSIQSFCRSSVTLSV